MPGKGKLRVQVASLVRAPKKLINKFNIKMIYQ
jgi:hypothetical protein